MTGEPKHCFFALSHLNHQVVRGRISACYRCSAELGSYQTGLMSNIVNGPAARAHRMTLQSGQWPDGCSSCRDFEESGIMSTRLHGLKDRDIHELLSDYDPETGAIRRLRSIELRFGNECNLACRHCNSAHSSRWEAMIRNDRSIPSRLHREDEPTGFRVSPGYYDDILENVVPGLDEILFAGGESLYQKKHYEFIDSIPPEHASHIRLLYVTNGTIRSLGRYDLVKIWKRFKHVRVVVSCDGVGKRFEYFRNGASWPVVEDNIRLWREEGFEVGGEITVSAYQMFYLRETFDYLYDNGLVQWISSSLVQHPSVINCRIIPDRIKLMLSEEWHGYLEKLDGRKRKSAIDALQGCFDYMRHDLTSVYDGDGIVPTWDDFRDQALEMDSMFRSDIRDAFPRIADTFP